MRYETGWNAKRKREREREDEIDSNLVNNTLNDIVARRFVVCVICLLLKETKKKTSQTKLKKYQLITIDELWQDP